jgi:hypothetical protein
MNLSQNNITPVGAKYLASALEENMVRTTNAAFISYKLSFH